MNAVFCDCVIQECELKSFNLQSSTVHSMIDTSSF